MTMLPVKVVNASMLGTRRWLLPQKMVDDGIAVLGRALARTSTPAAANRQRLTARSLRHAQVAPGATAEYVIAGLDADFLGRLGETQAPHSESTGSECRYRCSGPRTAQVPERRAPCRQQSFGGHSAHGLYAARKSWSLFVPIPSPPNGQAKMKIPRADFASEQCVVQRISLYGQKCFVTDPPGRPSPAWSVDFEIFGPKMLWKQGHLLFDIEQQLLLTGHSTISAAPAQTWQGIVSP